MFHGQLSEIPSWLAPQGGMNTTELRPRENPRAQTIRPSMANVPRRQRRAQGDLG